MKKFAQGSAPLLASPHKAMVWDEVGLNRYFGMKDFTEGMNDIGAGGLGFVEGAWDGDPNAFESAGGRMGGALSAPWAVFSSIKFGRDVHARIGGVDAFKRSGSWLHASGGARSSIYATGAAEGSLVGVAGRAQGRVLNGAAAKTWQSNRGLMSRVKGMQKTGLRSLFKGNGLAKGVWKNGQFLKSGSIATDIFLIAGGTVALNIAGSAIGGLAGRIADEALADSRNRRGMYYDNRYFDNRQYGYSTMQQVGMAMNNHGQNMMSVARIFHSR